MSGRFDKNEDFLQYLFCEVLTKFNLGQPRAPPVDILRYLEETVKRGLSLASVLI